MTTEQKYRSVSKLHCGFACRSSRMHGEGSRVHPYREASVRYQLARQPPAARTRHMRDSPTQWTTIDLTNTSSQFLFNSSQSKPYEHRTNCATRKMTIAFTLENFWRLSKTSDWHNPRILVKLSSNTFIFSSTHHASQGKKLS